MGFIALIGVLDSHDPSRDKNYTRTLQNAGLGNRILTDHHHILFQFEGSEEIIPTGLYVGQGEPGDLLFAHRRSHVDDEAALERMLQISDTVGGGTHGMYFISENEQLSATPQGQVHLRPDGSLLR